MPPALHHVAFASRNLEATHRFYGALLGLTLVNTELSRAETGWLRHVFYDLYNDSADAECDASLKAGAHK